MKLVVDGLRDLLIRILPEFKKRKEYGFAFLVHARNVDDVYKKYSFLKVFPKNILMFFTRHLWPITVSEVRGLKSQKTGRDIKGWIVAVPMTAKQMVENRELALKRIIQATTLAKKLGASIIGLGALTSSFSKGGLDIIDKVDINITTGHAFTAYIISENTFKLKELLGIDKETALIAIVGAAGSIGSTTSKIIARAGYKKLLLVDLERKKDQFLSLISELELLNKNIEIKISHQIHDVKSADFIITATNAPEALIKPEDLKSGAVIIDDAQPSDISRDVLDKEDALAIEAGVVHTPNIYNNFDFGLKDKFDNFSCMGEVMILASQEWQEHYVINRATLDLVDEISQIGKRLGFTLGKFQNSKEAISENKFNYIKNIINSNKNA